MNCIDCVWVFSCMKANENIKECADFVNAHRKIKHLENVDYEKIVKEILEDE